MKKLQYVILFLVMVTMMAVNGCASTGIGTDPLVTQNQELTDEIVEMESENKALKAKIKQLESAQTCE